MNTAIIDGNSYDLGATMATYSLDSDTFNDGGNWFVYREQTTYKDSPVLCTCGKETLVLHTKWTAAGYPSRCPECAKG